MAPLQQVQRTRPLCRVQSAVSAALCAIAVVALVACSGGGSGGSDGASAGLTDASPVASDTAGANPSGANAAAVLDIIAATAEGAWGKLNLNTIAEVWTPLELRPLDGAELAINPGAIVGAWSSFAWDSRRAELWIFGGGHANYPGNDTYRWRSATRRWERASLPSEIVPMNVPGAAGHYEAIDGADNAPVSAHTYDNNLYLPRIDRFITFGGAAYNSGTVFTRKASPTAAVPTGPYLFDPNRADANKVGGTTGSHVKRVAPYPEIVGGNMWSNRDFPGALTPIGGMTAYAEINGKDVVYIASPSNGATNLDLYEYIVSDPANRAADTRVQVGRFVNGTVEQGAGAFDPSRKLFVRTGSAAAPFVFWDLRQAGPDNADQIVVPAIEGGAFDFSSLPWHGMDFDPVRDAFVLWGGGASVWQLLPPDRAAGVQWVLRALPAASSAPTMAPLPRAVDDTGILGKWKYARDLDVFVALQDPEQGNVWFYKPAGWRDPRVARAAP